MVTWPWAKNDKRYKTLTRWLPEKHTESLYSCRSANDSDVNVAIRLSLVYLIVTVSCSVWNQTHHGRLEIIIVIINSSFYIITPQGTMDIKKQPEGERDRRKIRQEKTEKIYNTTRLNFFWRPENCEQLLSSSSATTSGTWNTMPSIKKWTSHFFLLLWH